MSNDEQMRETVRRARELMAFVSPDPDHWDDHNHEIAAALCTQELPALCDDNDALRAELARVTAERDAMRKSLEERDADVHRRVRASYDATIADCWRAEVARVTAERDALRAIVDGRSVLPAAPTDAELDRIECAGYRLVAAFDGSGEPVRWWVIQDGRLCAWPEVSRG